MIAANPFDGFAQLTPVERRTLLQLARASIRAAVGGDDASILTDLTPALCAPTAAFVSLHQGPHLRGCIGTLLADSPLHEAVARAAVSAALDDPRFPPLRPAELQGVTIEISRLSPLVPAHAEEICLGVHGVSLSLNGQRAVFLPQVASMHGWDRDRLLRELCRKALLAPDAWRHPDCQLMIFVAEVFGDAGG